MPLGLHCLHITPKRVSGLKRVKQTSFQSNSQSAPECTLLPTSVKFLLVNEYTPSGSDSVILIFCLLKGNNSKKFTLPEANNSFLKDGPHFGRVLSPRKANGSSQKLFPL